MYCNIWEVDYEEEAYHAYDDEGDDEDEEARRACPVISHHVRVDPIRKIREEKNT